MEYVICIVGLSAVGAAWDGWRRAIAASAAQNRSLEAEKAFSERLDRVENGQLAMRNHISELKNFLTAQSRKSR